MTFHVIITDEAESQIWQILGWLSDRTQQGAFNWYRRWHQVLQDLERSADTYGMAPESDDHSELIRQVSFRTRRGLSYRALFIIRGQNVHVLHVRGPGQDFVPSDQMHMPD